MIINKIDKIVSSYQDSYATGVTTNNANEKSFTAEISKRNGILLTKIGNITTSKKIKLLGADRKEIETEREGYRHF
mgnify:CR=1 FL=1